MRNHYYATASKRKLDGSVKDTIGFALEGGDIIEAHKKAREIASKAIGRVSTLSVRELIDGDPAAAWITEARAL